MSLLVHAQAASIMSVAFRKVAEEQIAQSNPERADIALVMAMGYYEAAQTMLERVRIDAEAMPHPGSTTKESK